VEAIGGDADRNDLGTKLPQSLGSHMVSRAICAIDHDFEAIEPQVLGKCRFCEVDVAPAGVIDAAGSTDQLGTRKFLRLLEPFLDLPLVIVTELVSVRTKQLDAVVGER